MKIALIVDNGRVARWQADALLDLRHCTDLVIYNCTNTPPSAKKARHGLYYLLNLLTVRNAYTRPVRVPDVPGAGVLASDFKALQEGNWQRLPDALLDRIADDAPAVILKFGMSLLRVPDAARLACPILSYHHGDPDAFRGRPAGFYEVLQGQPVMGQIVQILSNRLDGGRVVAFAETKVHRHSYKATLEEAFRHSRLLINTAIANANSGKCLDKSSDGPNYRLPTNAVVAGFWVRLAGRLAARIAYGAFLEKAWQVSIAPVAAEALSAQSWKLPGSSLWRRIGVPVGYSFIADPFFAPDHKGEHGAVIVEALRGATGKGELLHIDAARVTTLTEGKRHFSYPASVFERGQEFLVPEIAQWSSPKAYSYGEHTLVEAFELDIAGAPRLLDPTLHRCADRLFLFGNIASEGQNVLRLWHALSLKGRFVEHPASPILISPRGARMGGVLLDVDGRLFRFGQDFGGAYGDGLCVFEIKRLSLQGYSEKPAGAVKFKAVRGPHTLNLRGGEAVFDWYTERFSLLAGVRRLLGRYG